MADETISAQKFHAQNELIACRMCLQYLFATHVQLIRVAYPIMMRVLTQLPRHIQIHRPNPTATDGPVSPPTHANPERLNAVHHCRWTIAGYARQHGHHRVVRATITARTYERPEKRNHAERQSTQVQREDRPEGNPEEETDSDDFTVPRARVKRARR